MRGTVAAVALLLAGVTPGQSQNAPVKDSPPAASMAVQSPVLTIDSERMFRESAFGQRVNRQIDAQSAELAAENREIEHSLEAEERALTDKRARLEPKEFRALADAFDQKVQRTRSEQAAKNRALNDRLDRAREEFLEAAVPVLEQLMRNSDAAVILERRRVFVSSTAIEVTDAAIALLDETIGSGLSENAD